MPLMQRTARALQEALAEAAGRHDLRIGPEEVPVAPPRDPSHGHLASTVAMALAGRAGTVPRDVAARLKDELDREPPDSLPAPLESVEIAGPGFLNFRFAPSWLEHAVREVLEEGEDYGRSGRMEGEEVLFEFVSANPTGPLNVVSARAAAVGDVLASLVTAAGGRAGREFYVNDAGRQVRLLGQSLLARVREERGEEAVIPEGGYHGEYLAEMASALVEEGLPEGWEDLDEEERAGCLSRIAVDRILEGHRETLWRFRLSFDEWFRESSLHASGAVDETLADLRDRGCVYEEEGAVWFRSTDFGDDKDRVLVTSEGRPTYLLPDIAYHRDKYARGWRKLVDLWGPDHHGYIGRMQAALKALGHPEEDFRVLIVQQVNLLRSGEVVKMSKRSGRLIEMAELLDEVGTDAARFLFLTRSTNTPLDFDLDLAVAQNEENPVYYVQYAHARIRSLLRKAREEGIDPDLEVPGADLGLLTEEEERALLRVLAAYPDVVADAARSLEPHRIPAWLRDLAGTFHPFYHKHPVIQAEPGLRAARLALCEAVRQTLANGLGLLGVRAPERM
ncbi:MAG: arginine--tRNA ligase [bacterium]